MIEIELLDDFNSLKKVNENLSNWYGVSFSDARKILKNSKENCSDKLDRIEKIINYSFDKLLMESKIIVHKNSLYNKNGIHILGIFPSNANYLEGILSVEQHKLKGGDDCVISNTSEKYNLSLVGQNVDNISSYHIENRDLGVYVNLAFMNLKK